MILWLHLGVGVAIVLVTRVEADKLSWRGIGVLQWVERENSKREETSVIRFQQELLAPWRSAWQQLYE